MTVVRSTIQIVEAAVLYPTKVRLTQQYVQIAYVESDSEIFEEDASNAIILAQVASAYVIHTASASNAISLAQSVGLEGSIHNVAAANAITLAQNAVGTASITASASNAISLAHVASATTIRVASASNVITLAQSVSLAGSIHNVMASNAIVLSQIAIGSNLDISVTSVITLSQSVGLAGSVWLRPTSSAIVLTQSAIVSVYRAGIASNRLYPTQTASATRVISVSASSVLVPTQSVNKGGSLSNLSVSSTLSLTQHAVATVKKSYVLLMAPFPAVASSIILPPPEFDDKENNTSKVAIKRAMDGTTRTYVNRSATRVLSYTFDLTREKGLELEAFLSAYNGDKISLQNWKGELWEVHLLTNPLSFVQNRRSAPGGPSVGVNLQFEGKKVAG